MTTTDVIDVSTRQPLDRHTAIDLGHEAYRRFAGVVADLDGDDWDRPTDCDLWTVRDLVGHVGAMMWSFAKIRRTVREQAQSARRAKAEGIDPTDAMTAIQVERVAGLEPDELVRFVADQVEPAVAGRRRLPDALADRLKFPVEMGGVTEKWALSYLTGVILTRDTWLHRTTDLARATGREPRLDADHDGRIIADVVVEWARRHGKAFDLELGGPAGGRFRQGDDGPRLELDALEFCRMLSGRAEPTHSLLTKEVPF